MGIYKVKASRAERGEFLELVLVRVHKLGEP